MMKSLSTAAFLTLAAFGTVLPSAAFACAGHEETASAPGYGEVTLETVAQLVETKKATIVDANKAERYAAGHIPGALHARADENGKLTGAALPADKATKLVFYCHSEKCQASHMAAKAAVEAGYTDVHVYPGGIVGWEKAGKPVEKAAPKTAGKAQVKGQG
ncbi:rhodanese-like domain-containing protein [Myxococcota bacterium]|jgi:rhodanese-related sulfurtransferase|nr:rhodanese-like domain-containing protein [Myxococcota bacterium]